MEDLLDSLQRWYADQCNGEWEHIWGIEISTLDNPGWRVSIPLHETALENALFSGFRLDRTEYDWIDCKVEGNIFKGYGGPQNLQEILRIFHNWSKNAS
jgi:hypothetical protein